MGRGSRGEKGTISHPPQTWKKKLRRAGRGGSASRGDTRPISTVWPGRAERGPSSEVQLAASAPHSWQLLKLKLVGYFGGNVFEGHGGARYPLKPNTVERQPRQFAHLHLHCTKFSWPSVPCMHSSMYFSCSSLCSSCWRPAPCGSPHHLVGLHGARGLHAHVKSAVAGLGLRNSSFSLSLPPLPTMCEVC